ncbi:hypothetical protein [Vibrio rotiferianus]|uniref:hypothetical protein n=1 Tax=Vibrio rotiferianus TaxID=190895 RepID=UPI0028961625|nr:TPR_REGION domain-containing protein [Vibrio rotiferianus]
MKTKLITTLITGLLSLSAIAGGQPPTNYRPNENDPAYVAQDKTQTIQKRVTALESLRSTPSQNGLIAIARALKEDNTSIREAAIIGSYGLSTEYRWKLVSPFLKDRNPTLREAATYSLIRSYPQLTYSMKIELDKQIPDLEQLYLSQQDSFSRFKLAEVYRLTGETEKAIAQYQVLVDEIPQNQAVWVGLSESYRIQRQDKKVLEVLEQGINLNQNSSQLYYAKSLAEVRQDNKSQALSDIRSASILAETNSYYWYLYAMMQKEQNLQKSVPLFEHAYQLSGTPEQLFALCDVYIDTHSPAVQSCLDQLKPMAPKQVYAVLFAKSQHQINQ